MRYQKLFMVYKKKLSAKQSKYKGLQDKHMYSYVIVVGNTFQLMLIISLN